ncbi:MAG: valine--tRNA ligase [bacterium]|jgi:valyl-tRNA synthetase
MRDLPDRYDPAEAEARWQKHWEEKGIYRFDPTAPRERIYSIDTPPPTVSGLLHLGHIYSYTQMDIIARYQKLRGKVVFYPFGFDDNGLPTERMVERARDVRAQSMPREDFIKLCLEVTKDAEAEFKDMWQRMGLSVDWNLEYSTINRVSRRVAQQSFIDLYKKGHIYRREEPAIWDVDNRTALAQAEIEDREFDSTFNDILFTFEDGTKVAIATTRPELLPACVAVLCHPEDDRYRRYVGGKIKTPHFDLWVPVLTDPLVDPEKGTGIVMCCTFGDTVDIEWWKRYNLETRVAITPDGRLNELAGEFAGLKLEAGRKAIIEKLKEENLLTKQEKITHMVKCGEKSHAPVEYIITEQWFIRILDKKEELIRRAREIKWWPEFMWVRYQHWVENLGWDWCISRQRFYGVPFPVWYAPDGSVILADPADLPVDPTVDLPRGPLPCRPEELTPETDVMDTWMTSSCTPQLASGWLENPELFAKIFPMSLRPQAHDIIRTWAFYTIVKGLLHEDKMPWENVFISGHALDPAKKKMSKSKGNVVTPREYVDKYGADVLRYWTSTAKLGLDSSFNDKALSLGKRLLTKIFNASKFAHGHIADFDGSKPGSLHITDRWLLSKLGRVVETATIAYDEYEFCDARSAVEDFFWAEFCDNYLELAKGRLYGDSEEGRALRPSAQFTLYHSLLTILKMFAPTLPHVTEEVFSWMYAERLGIASIHLTPWPVAADFPRDDDAEALGDLAVELLAGVRKIKSELNVSIKRPVAKLSIAPAGLRPPDAALFERLKADDSRVLLDFMNAANVQSVEFASSAGELSGPVESPQGAFLLAAELAAPEQP